MTSEDDWVGDLTPIKPAEWNCARARHLLNRAGFGGTPEDIDHLAAMMPAAAVERLALGAGAAGRRPVGADRRAGQRHLTPLVGRDEEMAMLLRRPPPLARTRRNSVTGSGTPLSSWLPRSSATNRPAT